MIVDAILAKIFGTKNEREVKKMQPIVAAIGALEPQMQALSDIDLAAKTIEFKEKFAQGASLDDLDVPTLITLLGEIDQDSIPLLAAYLDRRQPRWREETPDGAAAADGSPPSRGGKMTEEEAYQILGIQPGSTAQDVARAHRSLIKKLHPDQGGSTYLAAQINEAKDVLTRGHR